MFEGSANVGNNEHMMYVHRNGGEVNGTTNKDRTNYFETLPSDRLELGLWLESDRMMGIVFDADALEVQRNAVKEERRLRIDNVPYGPARLAFSELIYDDWAYQHSTIGSMDDLDAASIDDVMAFFELYYAPNNAVLVLAGDVDTSNIQTVVDRYFGEIPRGEQPPPVVITEEMPRTEQRFMHVTDAFATQSALMYGWMLPQYPAEEHMAAQLITSMLAGGESSRLYARMVRNDQIALDVFAWVGGSRGPDAATVWATGNNHDPVVLQAALELEVGRLIHEGFTDEELEAARRQRIRAHLSRAESNLGRALTVGEYALYWDNANRINTYIDEVNAVTREQIEQTLATYFTNENASVLHIHVSAENEAPAETASTEGGR